MAMSAEDAERLRKSCLRAKRAPKPLRFFYCVAGADAAPVLLIGKRLQPAEIKAIRRSATKKRFLAGSVGPEDGKLVFRTEKPQKRFLKDLRTHFGQEIPALRNALLLALEEAVSEEEEQAAPVEDAGLSAREKKARAEAEAARERLRAQEEKTAAARAREAEARKQVIALITRIHEAVDDWAVLGADAAAVASLAEARQGELEAHFALLRQYLEGRIARRAQWEGVQTDAELEAVARRTEADARNHAYLALLDELRVAQSDLWEGAEGLFLLDAEIAECQAAEALAAAEQEEARVESVQATAALFELEDELAEILAQSPAAAPLLAETRALEDEADQLADDAMDLQMELSELEAERDALVAALVDAGSDADPALIGWLGELEGQIQTRDQELEAMIRQADTVHAEVSALTVQARAALAAAGDPRAQRVALQVERARAAVSACVATEGDAARAVKAAAAQTAERARRRAVAQVLAEAVAWSARTAPLLEVLDDIDPRDPAEAARSGALLSQPGVVNALADGQHYLRQLIRVGATAEEVAEIFTGVPVAWRPTGFASFQAQAAQQDAWIASTGAPLEDRLSALDSFIAAGGLVPDVSVPDEPRLLAAQIAAFVGAPEANARLEVFALAVELKARFQDAQDPRRTEEERAAATQAVLRGAAAEPRAALAWLAREGDASAQRLVCAPDQDDAALARAAPPVVLQALLTRAREGEGRDQTFEDWLSGLQRWTDGVFARAESTVAGWGTEATRWAGELRAGAPTTPLQITPMAAGMLEGLRHALAQLADKYARLRELPPDDGRASMLAQLDQARARFDRQVVTARAPLSRNLTELAALRAGLGAELAADALAQLDGVLHTHLVLLQNLSTAA